MSNKYKITGAIIIVILLTIGAFIGGRNSVPTKTIVQEKVKIQEVVKEVVVTKVETQIQTVYVKAEARDVRTETVVVKTPDGTETTKTVVEDKTKIDTKNNTDTNIVNNTVATKEKVVIVEKDKIVTVERNKPQWSIALQPGFDVAGALGKDTFNLMPDATLKRLVIGAAVEHRFIGPLFIGAWANTQGTGGLSVRMEF